MAEDPDIIAYMIIDPPVFPWSSPDAIREWIAELDVLLRDVSDSSRYAVGVKEQVRDARANAVEMLVAAESGEQ
jgi:hypothetical protein